MSCPVNIMRLGAASAAFSLVLLLVGCYVPPVWDIGDEINQVHWIEEGVTTKAEILDKLGEPDVNSANQRMIYYSGSQSAGAWFFAAGGQAAGGLLDEEFWTVRILFNEEGVVDFIMTSDDTPEERRDKERRIADYTTLAAIQAQSEEEAATDDHEAEMAAAFAPQAEPGPEPEPTHTKMEAQRYVQDHEDELRRGLYEYTREYGLIGSGRPYRDFRIYSSKVESVTDDRVIVEIPYSSKTTYNPNWFKRRFVMHWQGDDLAFAGHL